MVKLICFRSFMDETVKGQGKRDKGKAPAARARRVVAEFQHKGSTIRLAA
jgi:hypothetical protein